MTTDGSTCEPLGGTSARQRLHHIGQGRHVVGAAGLQRSDEMPARARHLTVQAAKFLHVVLADACDALLDRPSDGFGGHRLGRGDQENIGGIAIRSLGSLRDDLTDPRDVGRDLIG